MKFLIIYKTKESNINDIENYVYTQYGNEINMEELIEEIKLDYKTRYENPNSIIILNIIKLGI